LVEESFNFHDANLASVSMDGSTLTFEISDIYFLDHYQYNMHGVRGAILALHLTAPIDDNGFLLAIAENDFPRCVYWIQPAELPNTLEVAIYEVYDLLLHIDRLASTFKWRFAPDCVTPKTTSA
jgi:hypothetical protein